MGELFRENKIPSVTENDIVRNVRDANPQETNPQKYAGPILRQRIIGVSLEIGSGASAFYADKQGIWLGAQKFEDAPFSINPEGEANIGDIILADGGHIRSGQTAYETGTGFWLGDVSGTAKLSIGSSGNYLKWDGSSLSIKGAITGSTVTGTTITGGTLQTSSSTEVDRVKISGGNNRVEFWTQDNDLAGSLETFYEGGVAPIYGTVMGGGGNGEISLTGKSSMGTLALKTGNRSILMSWSGGDDDDVDMYPEDTGEISLGLSTNKWADVQSVLINGSDYGFENNWWITESYKIGIKEEGLAFLNNKDELVMFVGEESLYVPKGQIKDIAGLKYTKRTVEERKKITR